ncbi:MAG: exodeoxyribonuclease VII large subunit [Lachnospiraceae bacterium]|nr:exodeoxyribonuclease VII large subunit [Lachnospiraceae bacterium]
MQNKTYTVAQVNRYIAGMFADDLLLKNVSVKGEVGTCSYTASGHIYFSIKDKDAQIACVMWASRRMSGLKFKLATGMQVVVTGSVEVYERDGKYQIIATKVEEDGVGNIFEQFEALKAKLKEQGMFDEEFKRPIPKHIKTLGVVTASTGAAVRDIIDISKRRNPGIQIVLYPATVQGKDAPPTIIKGINALEEYGVDVIIVGRGGGSMEDLWCFNDEALAHTIFNAAVPVISAVGHETDFTIADFVADLRAPTPSAAAELAVADVSYDLRRLKDDENRLKVLMGRKISFLRTKVSGYSGRVKALSPGALINAKRNRLASLEERLNVRIEKLLTQYKTRVSMTAQSLHALSPLNKLGNGYVYASAGGASVKSVKDIKAGDEVRLDLKDGSAVTKVVGTTET